MIESLTIKEQPVKVLTARNKKVLDDETDIKIMEALALCESKVMHRDEKGQHKETHLGIGLHASQIHGTRCYINLERVSPTLRENLCPAGLKPSVIDRVNLYVSPPGTGAPLHFDICTVVVIQLTGCKLWQVSSAPAVAQPEFNTVADEAAGIAWHGKEQLPLPDKMHFIYLEPGDWLLIPRGAWHATFSGSGSVAATLALKDNIPEEQWRELTKNSIIPPQGKRLPC